MDADSNLVIGLLEAIATSNEELVSLSEMLRSHPSVIRVLRGFDCRNYRTGVRLEWYVDAELRSGHGMCWSVDVSWAEANWVISSKISINRNGDQGQDVLKEFADKSAQTLKDFISQLRDTMSDLAKSPINIELVTANG